MHQSATSSLKDPKQGHSASLASHVGLAGAYSALGQLSPETPLGVKALAELFGWSTRTVHRAVQSGDLPPPFKLMGRNTWLAKTILEDSEARQEGAVRLARRRLKRLIGKGS